MSEPIAELRSVPVDPPEGCASPLMWRMARELLARHQPRGDGFCDCGEFMPCAGRELAVAGFYAALMPVSAPPGLYQPRRYRPQPVSGRCLRGRGRP